MAYYVSEWYTIITDESGQSGNGRNKLRAYRLFKSAYKAENYCTFYLPGWLQIGFFKI